MAFNYTPVGTGAALNASTLNTLVDGIDLAVGQTSSLYTVNKSAAGGINELYQIIDPTNSGAGVTAAGLNTNAKHIVGAINELLARAISHNV